MSFQTSATSIDSSGKTGGICGVSGPYKSGRRPNAVIYFKRGDKFSADVDGKATSWTLVKE